MAREPSVHVYLFYTMQRYTTQTGIILLPKLALYFILGLLRRLTSTANTTAAHSHMPLALTCMAHHPPTHPLHACQMLTKVVYLCIIFVSMHSIFAFSICACWWLVLVLVQAGVSEIWLRGWWTSWVIWGNLWCEVLEQKWRVNLPNFMSFYQTLSMYFLSFAFWKTEIHVK